MIRSIAVSVVAVSLSLGAFGQDATPEPAKDFNFQPDDANATVGCEGIADYQDELFTLMSDHELFAEFWSTGDRDSIQNLATADAEDLVADGRELIAELEELTIPETYVRGHEGVILLFDSELDVVSFLGIDASEPIDYDQWDRGLALILAGELLTAKACPDEIDEVGGYIFFPPRDLEEVF